LSIYDSIGGEPAVRAAVDDFYARILAAAHAGLGVGDGDFDAVVGHLVGTLTALGVPENTIGQIGEALAPLRGAIVTAPRADLAG
jgi:hemoglobin